MWTLFYLDTGWLWPFEETIRKAARSWSSQIDLMDRYPEYKFICSQAQQYEWVKDNYPALWDRIKEKISTGQFLPTGGVSYFIYKRNRGLPGHFIFTVILPDMYILNTTIRHGLKWILICLVENHFADNFYWGKKKNQYYFFFLFYY